MKDINFYELTVVVIIFCSVLVLIFISMIVLIVKYRNGNNEKVAELEIRIRDAEALVKSQTGVNEQVIKMINSINKLIAEK